MNVLPIRGVFLILGMGAKISSTLIVLLNEMATATCQKSKIFGIMAMNAVNV
jgi:hypothetical protein